MWLKLRSVDSAIRAGPVRHPDSDRARDRLRPLRYRPVRLPGQRRYEIVRGLPEDSPEGLSRRKSQRKLPLTSSQRPGNLPSVAHSHPLQAQGSGAKPTRQILPPPSTAVSFGAVIDQPAEAKARAAARTVGPAWSRLSSRSSLAGGTSSNCGFIPWNHACTTAGESRSASNAATW